MLKIISISVPGFAQEYAVWKYSGQTFSFNTEPPTFSSTSTIADGYYNASICDTKGNLKLLISVDSTVHFLNATGVEIGRTGNPSRRKTTYGRYNTGLLRLNDSLIFFFYTSGMANLDLTYLQDSVGLFMTAINTNLNNGVGGIVPTTKDVRISPLPHGGITFRMNSDSSWWIISEHKDSLFAYRLMQNGSLLPPVITALGELSMPRDTFIFNPYHGEMRFSHDGNFFVRTASWRMPISKKKQISIFAYSFNETTGTFTNQVLIEKQVIDETTSSGNLFNCTDIVFAPNDSLLYLVYSNHASQKNVVQFNRYSPNIAASAYVVHNEDGSDFGGIVWYASLGQNGKIYLGSDLSNYSIIYRPNLPREKCTFLLNRMTISCSQSPSGNGCSQPNFPFSLFHRHPMNFDYRMNCDSTIQVLNLSDTINLKNFSWYLYGPNSFIDSVQATNPVFKLTDPGEYWIKFKGTAASGYQPWFSDSIHVVFLDVPKAHYSLSNTKGCQYVSFSINEDGSTQLVHPTLGQKWTWSFGDGTDTTIAGGASGDVSHTYVTTGNYIISLSYTNGYCSDSFSATSTVTIDDAPQPGIIIDTHRGCYPLVVKFADEFSDPIDSVALDFGDGVKVSSLSHIADYSHTYSIPGAYQVVQFMYGSSGCVSVDSVQIEVLKGFAPGQTLELAYTTLSQKHIVTKWLPIEEARRYLLERHDEKTNLWKQIYFGQDTLFEDASIDSLMRYRYRVTGFDTCDQAIVSNEGSNIVLNGSNINNTSSLLSWNPYSLWVDGLKEYTLYKVDPITGSSVLLVSTTDSSYDDQDFFTTGTDSVCYQVVATSFFDSEWQSLSNIACVRYAPTIWIPNSFSPNNNGLNEVFMPVTMGIRDENYEFVIYDRWGAEIFRSTSKTEGWDGNFKSKQAPSGLYFYRLSYATLDLNGKYSRMNATGSIVLLR